MRQPRCPDQRTILEHTLRILDQRSFIAITVFLLSGMIGFFVLYNAMSNQKEDGDALRYAGRQEVLFQSIAAEALRLRGSTSAPEQQTSLQTIQNLRAELAEGSTYLTSDIVPVQIATYYANLWHTETGEAFLFLKTIERALSDPTVPIPQPSPLLEQLDTGAKMYLAHYQGEIHHLEWSIIGVTLVQLLLVAVIYATVLKPMRKTVHQQMRRMQLFSKAVEQSGSMVVVTDANSVISYANQRTIAYSGYQLDELVGQTPRLFQSDKTSPHIYKSLWQTLEKGEVWEGELQNRRKDGSLYWVQATISPIKTEQGVIEGYLSIEHDITIVKQALEENEEVREQLLTAIEAIDDAFALFDKNERLILWNSRCQMIFHGVQDLIRPGITFEELLREGARRGQYSGVDDQEQFVRQRLESFRTAEGEFEVQLANGTWLLGADRKTVDGGRVMLRIDITRIKEAEEALRVAKGQADAANQAKSAFLSSMSHELRTPLNAILGFAQMMQIMPGESLTKQQDKCVNHILKGGQHLLELINEVLDLAKIEAGKVEVSIEPLHLGDLLAECLSLVTGSAQARNIAIHTPKTTCIIRADHTRARQVILNLLSNAVKYNSLNGSISITTHLLDDGDRVRLTVSDTGPGIPLEKQGDMFKPFNRLGAETSDIEGTGIGLSITRQLIRLMGGEISFVSVPGKGSAFSLDFLTHTSPGISLPAISDSTPVERLYADLAGTVVCVEDNPANITLLEMIFSSVPRISVSIATSAEDGLEIIGRTLPDLVLMDVNLPGISGFEAVEELRKDPTTSHIPVVAMTANAANNIIPRGLSAGFTSVLIKPIVIPDLMNILANHLQGGRDANDSSASAAE
ncbi:PAS domain-containing hybrid sensor histidine kinase/response regulator [Insolitispirillum peregrinum]|uniref:PAS domain-containing hybrid sensor histidine kinase/response regulator n=1 Tax=Insolitispirillum peregrinum TaxID=80876 RepID=UPI003611C9F6